ncbi:hypothetical protein BJY52DRAFT_1281284 [Lactarius psammicola]|nr:hypothetical protein BJY52DRAFT_1281284 [Lactarius psammicola]
MSALVSAPMQIPHIQSLSLTYPSRLEAQFISVLLSLLAILAAGMRPAPLHSSQQFNNVARAVRNVCNATLSILFTLSLAICSLVVNRKQAWRTDGGTAALVSYEFTCSRAGYKPPTARLQTCDHICNPESLPLPPSPIRVALGIQSVHVIRFWWVWTTGCHSRPKLSEPQNPNKEDDDLDNNGSSRGGRCGHSVNVARAPIAATTVRR